MNQRQTALRILIYGSIAVLLFAAYRYSPEYWQEYFLMVVPRGLRFRLAIHTAQGARHALFPRRGYRPDEHKRATVR